MRKLIRTAHGRTDQNHVSGKGAACKRITILESDNGGSARKFDPACHPKHKLNLRNVRKPQAPRPRDFRFADTAEDDLKTPLQRVLARLENVQRCGDGYSARCPAHADSKSSLTVNEDESGKVLLHCHAVCSFEQVVQALNLRTSDLFPATSKTEDPEGEVVAKEVPRQAANDKAPTDKRPAFVPCEPKPVSAEGSQQDWAVFAQRRQDEAGDPVVEMLAGELGVSAAALRQLQIGWHENQKCYTFPERNGKGEVVGISCRSEDGRRKRSRAANAA